ncbi:hypothetical protein FT663_00561 [Candidozyma haemuli var. vulneris]|uniref:C2H2-type domain-containing protein n=1 Tax=Candidozyma haemuli TaxID=45357 RepID=A0A2V1B0T4_9ASCO|nr:hypothetical protein CXQ85_004035 [[Candida] haemuloni]KAF3993287.1 hypothetical protein FT662_00667 [[Candida] haemuloni var. vulneris]KAF3995343.1 hypothetical protein FT663_00561 [[Candida] haemuloni var. vulneris]PVH23742.1 hypothetical protein CXQ85_004035 [[Candida] haemuloni]
MVKTEPVHEDDSVRKKKRRNLGQFPCSQCSKVFTRSDHLARHYLNHQPKEVYVCEKLVKNHNGESRVCGKTFVRKDLKERHLKRHKMLDEQDGKWEDESDQSPSQSVKHEELRAGEVQEEVEIPQTQPPVHVQNHQNHQPVQHQQNQHNVHNQQLQPLPNQGVQNHPLPNHQIPNQPLQGDMNVLPPQHQGMPPFGGPPQVHFPNHNPNIQIQGQMPHMGLRQQQVAPPPPLQMGPSPPDMYRMNPNMPQSQTDILSWLFTDQDPGLPKDLVQPYSSSSNISMSPEVAANGMPMDMTRQISPRQHSEISPMYYNAVPEAMINMNLQDLNFFSNNDNPLDEVFLRPSTDPTHLGDATAPKGPWNISSTNSSTPNTTDTLTPRSVGDHSPEALTSETIENRVAHHTAKNIAKNRHYHVDAVLVERLASCLPGVTLESLSNILRSSPTDPLVHDRLSFYLYGYWEIFHPKFSILHKPSFDTKTAEPLLLLAMIIVGCSYCRGSTSQIPRLKHCPEYNLATLVALPLRFTLFQHEDFRSPVRVWILQTLNLLEWCEKNRLQRHMHERAHIHHGTTVQLLRRSPFLGGNPTVANKELTSASEANTSAGEEDGSMTEDMDEAARSDQALFNKWVESESMKRVTFMTFYLDVIDYIKFRHNPQIPFFQLQLLNLPCEEDALWASYDINGSFKKTIRRQKKLQKANQNSNVRPLKNQNQIKPGMNFLSALKKIMKQGSPERAMSKVSFFTKSILFGGIVSIMHSMQQTELQSSFSQIMSSERYVKNRNQKWKEILTVVFDEYDHEIYAGSSGFTKDAFFNVNRWQCKFPMYHLAQIMGMSDLNHYDIAIYGGSPANMSVDATSKDFSIVQKKLNSMWTRSLPSVKKNIGDLINYKSVIHCYWLLWGLMLTPLGKDGNPTGQPLTYDWRVEHDIHDSLYAVSVATMVLWCFCYSVYGPESTKFAEHGGHLSLEDTRNLDKIAGFAGEDGYQYLFRIRQEFTEKIKSQNLLNECLLHSTRSTDEQMPTSQIVHKYSEILPMINNKQNISGLCFLVGTKLLRSEWSVLRENAKLIINCGLRSAGKAEVHCPDLFKDDFVN